jgi:hypothetical protein
MRSGAKELFAAKISSGVAIVLGDIRRDPPCLASLESIFDAVRRPGSSSK